MQSLVNLLYGIAAGAGLYFLGVPYPLVWAALAAVLRFIPYAGPVLGAGAPILVSLAAMIRARRPIVSSGTSRPSPRARCTTPCCCPR
jgi:hypothetical protein